MCAKKIGQPQASRYSKSQILVRESRPETLRAQAFILLFSLFILCGCGGVNLNTPNTLSATPSSIAFGTVVIGKSGTAIVILKNRGVAPVTISSLNFDSQLFSVSANSTLPISIAPQASYNLAIRFNPSAIGSTSGKLLVGTGGDSIKATDLGGTKIALEGAGVPAISSLSCSQPSAIGSTTDSCSITLNAATGDSGLVVNLASSVSNVKLPATVTVPANSASASFSAAVSTVVSPQSATLTASEGGSTSSFALQLVPNGPALVVNSSGISFGTTALNMPVTQDLVLMDGGTQTVAVSSVVLAGAGFTIPAGAFPITVSPGQTATLHVQFNPTALGAATGSLTINSNSLGNGATAVTLSGKAVAYEVQLNWTAPNSESASVTGYKVLRSTGGSSAYQLLNSSVVPDTEYTDTTVQSGDVYDYVVESVDSTGAVSPPSNTTTVTVP